MGKKRKIKIGIPNPGGVPEIEIDKKKLNEAISSAEKNTSWEMILIGKFEKSMQQFMEGLSCQNINSVKNLADANEKNIKTIAESLKTDFQIVLDGQSEMRSQYTLVQEEQKKLHWALVENIGDIKKELGETKEEVRQNKLERQSQINAINNQIAYLSKEIHEMKGNICSATMRKVCAIYLKRNINTDKIKNQKKEDKIKDINELKRIPIKILTNPFFWTTLICLLISGMVVFFSYHPVDIWEFLKRLLKI